MNPTTFGNPPAGPAPAGMPSSSTPDASANMLGQAISQALTPVEFAELDQYITPRFVELVSKIDPQLGPLLAPFIQNDEALMDAESQMGAMGNGMPDTSMEGPGHEAAEYGPNGYVEEDPAERQNPFQNVWARS